MSIDNVAPRYWAVVPAAGVGKRFGADTPKQYLTLGQQQRTVMQHTIDRLCQALPISRCVLVIAADDQQAQTLPFEQPEQIAWAIGGAERMDSVLSGLLALAGLAAHDDWVLVHDVARPCITANTLQRLCQTLQDHPTGGVLAIPVRDTLTRADVQGVVTEAVNREQMWQVQTPQMFRYGLLLAALQSVAHSKTLVTDEASAMRLAGHTVQLVAGRADNIKITYADDLQLAAAILQAHDAMTR